MHPQCLFLTRLPPDSQGHSAATPNAGLGPRAADHDPKRDGLRAVCSGCFCVLLVYAFIHTFPCCPSVPWIVLGPEPRAEDKSIQISTSFDTKQNLPHTQGGEQKENIAWVWRLHLAGLDVEDFSGAVLSQKAGSGPAGILVATGVLYTSKSESSTGTLRLEHRWERQDSRILRLGGQQ